MDVPMELSRILITEFGDQQVIFLKEKGGDRSFPILIGTAEALAIDRRLKNIPTPRPMTHDLLANIIAAMGGKLDHIVINDIRDHTFIATLYIRRGEDVIAIDSRPSDAIALALRAKADIFVAQKVVDGSQKLDMEALQRALDSDDEDAEGGEAGDEGGEKKRKGKDRWTEILENLKPEDFGKYKM